MVNEVATKLTKLAEKIDELVSKIEEEETSLPQSKTAQVTTARYTSLGETVSKPNKGHNPLLDFILS